MYIVDVVLDFEYAGPCDPATVAACLSTTSATSTPVSFRLNQAAVQLCSLLRIGRVMAGVSEEPDPLAAVKCLIEQQKKLLPGHREWHRRCKKHQVRFRQTCSFCCAHMLGAVHPRSTPPVVEHTMVPTCFKCFRKQQQRQTFAQRQTPGRYVTKKWFLRPHCLRHWKNASSYGSSQWIRVLMEP